jgi:hypothetical protein
MILYHGSTLVVDKPRIITAEYGRDFGAGFYTTDIKEQAERWARRKAKILRRKSAAANAVLSIYEFDENACAELKILRIPEPSLQWLDLVCACRSDIAYCHGYDIVIGKIANDNVGATVQYVVQGIMRKEDALERLRFEKINNQFCFSTEKSLLLLKYIDSEEVSHA